MRFLEYRFNCPTLAEGYKVAVCNAANTINYVRRIKALKKKTRVRQGAGKRPRSRFGQSALADLVATRQAEEEEICSNARA